MGFKIATAYVSVEPDDSGFETELREQIKAAAAGVKAEVGLDVRPDAAEALAPALGVTLGEQLADALGKTVEDELPVKLGQPFKDAGVLGGDVFTRAFSDEMDRGLTDTGIFGGSLADAIGKEGAPAGEAFTVKFSESVKDEMTRSTIAGMLAPDGPVGEPIVEDAEKTGTEAGKKMGDAAGKAAGDGMSPLILAAITTAAAVGAPALLAGLGAAFVGVTAIALDQNKVIAADYKALGTEAKDALQQAVEPLAPTMHAALTSLSADLKGLQPTLDGLFDNAGPDITAFTGGVEGLVGNALPGVSKALSNSQIIAADFGTSMGRLGTGAGTFFTGLTRDSTTTGQGLSDVVGIASNALGTLGNIAGSASSAISADLMAVTPAINGVLDGLNKLASPATVGAVGGAFAAFKLGGPLESGLDKASSGLASVAAKADGAGGLFGKLSGAAAGSSMGLSKMATVMGGPWGIAIGAGVGLLSGLVGSMISAADATKAVTLSSVDLEKAISQDGGAAGQATAAYVATQESASGLSTTAAAAGVSTSTWTQAVLGNKQAHDQVVDSINKANEAQLKQQVTTDQTVTGVGKEANAMQIAATATDRSKESTNQTTDANQKLINSLNAQTQEVANAIAAQTKYQQALNAVDNSEQLFDASLTAAHNQLVANAQASAITTVGSLNLGNANYAVTKSLDGTVTAYSEAQSEGSAYGQVLTALSGNINNLLGTEAAFTTSLLGVTAAAKANGTSLDVTNAKGAANITTFTGVANAADKAAAAVYQNEVSNKGANKAYDDANTKLAQEKSAFEATAEKAGFSATAVQKLANELFALPTSITIPVNVTVSSSLDKLSSPKLRATGGPASPSDAYIVGDGGVPEYFVPDTPGRIYPSVGAGQQAIASHNAKASASSSSRSGGGAPGGGNTFIFSGSQYPTVEQIAQLNMQYATALGGVG